MAGHSQFKNIMFRKGAQDKKKAKLFAKLAKEITVAAKSGMPEPERNPRLRLAIQKARVENMPKDNIERAIKKADPSQNEGNYVEIRYEGYGPASSAVIVEALTDNKNRTATNVRTVFSKRGGALGETNSVAFNFERIGYIEFPTATASADDMFEAALEAGANEVVSDEEIHAIETTPDELSVVATSLEEKYGTPTAARLEWKTLNKLEVKDVETAKQLMDFVDALEDDDDVQDVYYNFEIAPDVLSQLG